MVNVREIESIVNRVSKGDLSREVRLSHSSISDKGGDEFAHIASAFNRMLVSIRSLITEAQTLSEQVVVAEQRIATIQIDTKTLAIGQGADEALTSAQGASEICISLAEDARKLAAQIEGFKL